MPRTARKKQSDAIFHIMCRSITEVALYKDNEDKAAYLFLIGKYKKLYEFRVYAYCLMNNHVHLIIDANGADISRVMHSINFSYVQYFNRKYNRYGHLFQDRFKSKIVYDDRYLMTLSAYVHNNPADIPGYKEHPENYCYSSLAIYMGLRQDTFELIDDDLLKELFPNGSKKARDDYYELVCESNDMNITSDTEFIKGEIEYKSERKVLVRNINVEEIVKFIASKMNITKESIYIKNSRRLVEAKALIVLLMRSLCNFKCSDICNILGNITQSRVSKLSSIGIELVGSRSKHSRIIEEFMECYCK